MAPGFGLERAVWVDGNAGGDKCVVHVVYRVRADIHLAVVLFWVKLAKQEKVYLNVVLLDHQIFGMFIAAKLLKTERVQIKILRNGPVTHRQFWADRIQHKRFYKAFLKDRSRYAHG